MATNDVDTTTKNVRFNFDEWIANNALDAVKKYFTKHNMTTLSTLSTQSKEFSHLISDQTLLMKKSQFIPKIFSALQALQVEHMNHNSRVIVISEKENKILKSMKYNLNHLENTENEIKDLNQESFEAESCLKTSKNSQIEDAKKKVTNAINNAVHQLKSKEKQILEKLDMLCVRRRYDNDIEHPILKQTKKSLAEATQALSDSMKQLKQLMHSAEHQDIDKRKRQICDINDNAVATFEAIEQISKADKLRVRNQISYNNQLCRQKIVDVNIDTEKYARLINGIESIATVQIQNYLPLQQIKVKIDANKKRLWNEMTRKKYTALMEWLRNNGAMFANFNQKKLNGIFATSEGDRGMVYGAIPPKCIMTLEISKASPIGQKLLNSHVNISSEHTYVAAYLLVEKKKGMNSFWYPFINMLPTQFNTVPIYYRANELRELKGSMAIEKISKRLDAWHAQYDSLKDVFESENISFDDFCWARLVTITRIFGMTIKDTKTSGLVPFADLFDHKKKKNVQWTYDNNQSAFIVQASRHTKIGEELFVTYGRKCNSRFFVNYGFIHEEENEDNEARILLNVCKLAMSTEELDMQKSEKIKALCDLSQDGYNEMFIVGNKYDGTNTKRLFGLARLMSCDEKELDSIDSVWSLSSINALSLANEKKALKLISKAAQLALDSFDTTIFEDAELLENKTLNPVHSNQRYTILMRSGEKQILNIYANIYSQFIRKQTSYIQLVGYINVARLYVSH